MHLKIRRIVSRLPSGWQEHFLLSNHPFVRMVRAKIGIPRSKQATTLATNPEKKEVGHCPLCARVFSCGEVLTLFVRDRTLDNPNTRISKEHTVWVVIDEIFYQIGCIPPFCEDGGLFNKTEEGDRYGVFDSSGVLIRVTNSLVKEGDVLKGGKDWNHASIPCVQRSR